MANYHTDRVDGQTDSGADGRASPTKKKKKTLILRGLGT